MSSWEIGTRVGGRGEQRLDTNGIPNPDANGSPNNNIRCRERHTRICTNFLTADDADERGFSTQKKTKGTKISKAESGRAKTGDYFPTGGRGYADQVAVMQAEEFIPPQKASIAAAAEKELKRAAKETSFFLG